MLGLNLYSGMLLAELSLYMRDISNIVVTTKTGRRLSQCAPFALVLLGLLALSHPKDHSEWVAWSLRMDRTASRYLPANADIHDVYSSVGAQLLTLSVIISPALQKRLGHPFLVWMGGISFSMYLLHGCIIRIFYVWLLYGLRKPILVYSDQQSSNFKGVREVLPDPERWMYIGALTATYCLILFTSHLFVRHVELPCERVTKIIERKCCSQPSDAIKADGVCKTSKTYLPI